ncbi:P-loop containing nucleoside triphosphate hydrolase protein [Collybia nuda]|uniref:P-loop containing nucleoside triphosphate hydrolase protein n=1 Tax=Collybia nuda TaxID=64659 RepID=A0A9P6CJA3_9AGAR|nr:P-loop containing nucleoside triphosphate hydrolase protein [Collybia nuda]
MHQPEPAVSVSNLTYSHNPPFPPALLDINLHLPRGSRTIVVGANGAGKSTLLQILAGKRLITAQDSDVRIKGRDVFRDSPPGVTFLGTEWAMNPVVRGDIIVSAFLDSVGGYRHKERRDHLLDILDVDLDWHMHQISDGERRRVQLCFGLMVPWDVLLLDEVTVDLDVLVRDDLLKFLKNDSETRGATILCKVPSSDVLDATHIFDGLNDFPTHVAHMRFGSFVIPPAAWPVTPTSALVSRFAPATTLYSVALQWLKEDRDHRRELEKRGRKSRGARRNEACPNNLRRSSH